MRCGLQGPHDDPNNASIAFHEAIPWVEEAAAIRFLRGREVLHVHEIEAEAPTLELPTRKVRAAHERLTLKWQGQHPERDLTYLVRYSNDDGATWRGVAVATSADESHCALDQHRLPGGDRCLLQVIATSGIRTSVVDTQPFSGPRDPRTAAIISATCDLAGQVFLRGGAFSSDYGLGQPEDVVWSSNVDGVLGRGFELVADGLWRPHTVTLTAPNGQGGVATTSRAVRVRAAE